MCRFKYIVLFLVICVQSVHVDAKDDGTIPMFSVEQLHEDFEHYIRELKDSHPDLYVYSSKEEFDNRVESMRKRINKPMTKLQFGLLLMELNYLLDGHSGLGFFRLEEADNHALVAERDTTYHGKFLPWMDMRDNQLYYKDEQVISINGKKAQDIIDFFNLRVTANDSYRRRDVVISHYLCSRKFSYSIFKLISPFCIKTKSTDGVQKTYEDKGWSIEDYCKLTKDIPTVPMECSIFPKDSIACIDFNTCSPGRYGDYKHVIDSVFEDIQAAAVKYLFINVVFNEGGYLTTCYHVLGKLKHKAFCWPFESKFKVTKSYCLLNNKSFDYYAENKDSLIYDDDPFYFDEVTSGYSGQVFVIQSPWTFSGANDFCHLIRRSERGLLIGGTTGQKNLVLYGTIDLALPHTKLVFHCSTEEYMHKERNEDGLCPDVPIDIGVYQAKFKLDDLKGMLEAVKQRQHYSSLSK